MFYYLYEIRNKINDKIYVGVHKTPDMNDGYMGSGKIIKRAIEKHGIENFDKIILETFNDAESMFAREKEVVTEEFLVRDDTYNLCRGGSGGFDYINKNGLNLLSPELRSKGAHSLHRRVATDVELAGRMREIRSSRFVELHRVGHIKYDTFTGKNHSEETKAKMRKPKNVGDSNSQFGTCWMWHELIGNKKCKKDMLPLFIEQGWVKGRKNTVLAQSEEHLPVTQEVTGSKPVHSANLAVVVEASQSRAGTHPR